MNDERNAHGFVDLDHWPPMQPLDDLMRFGPVVALSTVGGCCAVGMCLWSVVPPSVLAWWFCAGLALTAVQWQTRCFGGAGGGAGGFRLDWRHWVVANAFGAGLFWGVTSLVLFPADSVVHQAMLAFVLMTVTALWLPLFALVRTALFLFAVPAVLPMAFDLLTSPQVSQATLGSLLLLLFAALAAVTQTTSRVFFADFATRRTLYHQATHDQLVGLANRAEFHRRARALDAARSRAHAILFIDLDHFKEVNDTAGHAIGDELLRQIGAILRQAIRKGDTAARLGGDEFAILMQDCGHQDATRVAATILERINSFTLSSDTGCYRVTASLGIACSSDRCMQSLQILEAADHACYLAKRSGRNRFEIAAQLDREMLRQSIRAESALVTHAST